MEGKWIIDPDHPEDALGAILAMCKTDDQVALGVRNALASSPMGADGLALSLVRAACRPRIDAGGKVFPSLVGDAMLDTLKTVIEAEIEWRKNAARSRR